MAAVNRVTLLGNVGKDPEVKYAQSGDAVANVSIATTEKWKDKEGNKQESTEWHRLVFWGKLAEIVGEYVKKGSPIYVEGKLKTRKWQRDGVDIYTTEVHVREMQMLGTAPGGNASAPSKPAASKPAPKQEEPANEGGDGFTDQIPF